MSPIMRTKRKNNFSIVRNDHGHPNECFFHFMNWSFFSCCPFENNIVTNVTLHYIAFFLHELKEHVVLFDSFEKSYSHKFYICMICFFHELIQNLFFIASFREQLWRTLTLIIYCIFVVVPSFKEEAKSRR